MAAAKVAAAELIWSGKTTAKSGDLYFFWFDEPLLFLGGIGIHDGTFHCSRRMGEAPVASIGNPSRSDCDN